MSEHPQLNEGSGEGGPSGSEVRPLRHNWFFYVAGFFLVIAVICFVLSNTLIWHPPIALPPPQPAPSSSGGEK